MDHEKYLAERIHQEMEKNGWSQIELAERVSATGIQMRQSTISKILGDARRTVSVNELVAFSTVFGIHVPDLIGEGNNQHEANRRRKARALIAELDRLV